MRRDEQKTLSPEKWQRLEELFRAASALPPEERVDFLARACPDDEELRREAESLLDADESGGDFLESGAFTLGMEVLVGEDEMSSEDSTLGFDAEPPRGTTIDDRYMILEALDAGGMGTVFKARDLKFPDRPIAIKILKKESKNQP